MVVRGPWVDLPVAARGDGWSPRAQEPDLTTPAVVAAHPAALMLLLVGERLQRKVPVRAISRRLFSSLRPSMARRPWTSCISRR